MAVNHYTRLADGVDTTVLNLARRHQEGRVSEDDTTVTFRFTDRGYSPAPARRRGSGAARGYWDLLGTTMKGQVSGSGHLDGSIVCPPGTKAYGGSIFVAGLALLFGGGNVATTENRFSVLKTWAAGQVCQMEHVSRRPGAKT